MKKIRQNFNKFFQKSKKNKVILVVFIFLLISGLLFFLISRQITLNAFGKDLTKFAEINGNYQKFLQENLLTDTVKDISTTNEKLIDSIKNLPQIAEEIQNLKTKIKEYSFILEYDNQQLNKLRMQIDQMSANLDLYKNLAANLASNKEVLNLYFALRDNSLELMEGVPRTNPPITIGGRTMFGGTNFRKYGEINLELIVIGYGGKTRQKVLTVQTALSAITTDNNLFAILLSYYKANIEDELKILAEMESIQTVYNQKTAEIIHNYGKKVYSGGVVNYDCTGTLCNNKFGEVHNEYNTLNIAKVNELVAGLAENNKELLQIFADWYQELQVQ